MGFLLFNDSVFLMDFSVLQIPLAPQPCLFGPQAVNVVTAKTKIKQLSFLIIKSLCNNAKLL
jgi:hypothetical protein